MPRFIQLHILTSYPPSNLNRDDLGRPKTAWMGGTQRLRVSSQSLKRAWRTSEVFKDALNDGVNVPLSKAFQKALDEAAVEVRKIKPHKIDLHPHLGVRTKDIGYAAKYAILLHAGGDDASDEVKENVVKWAQKIADRFGKLDEKYDDKLRIGQIAHFSMSELKRIDDLTKTIAENKRAPKKEELDLLRHEHQSVDIALFGRMLAGTSDRASIWDEGTTQVAHAITVHKAEVEDDYFTAVDDLNVAPGAQSGSGFLDTLQFGAGLFYLYICIDCEGLQCNLSFEKESKADDNKDNDSNETAGDDPGQLTKRTLKALTEAIVRVTPSGKRNAFGHHTNAHYVLAERGDQQPRSLAVAFLNAVKGNDEGWLIQARNALADTCRKMDNVYGACAERQRYQMDVANEHGTLEGLKKYVADEGEGNWTPHNDQQPEEEA